MFKINLFLITLLSLNSLIHSNKFDFVNSNNRLALNLLNVLPKVENNFFSPLSISSSLYMLLNGANGVTEKELKTLLNVEERENSDTINTEIRSLYQAIQDKNQVNEVVVRFANLILTSNTYKLLDRFENSIKNNFNGNIESVDFTKNTAIITDRINEWVREQTDGKIGKLFNELGNDTLLVIANALYFSAKWEYPFDPYNTREDTFNSKGLEDKPSKVQMMRQQRKFRYTLCPVLNASIIELPFTEESNTSMVVILPDSADGLEYTIKNLDLDTLNTGLNKIRTQTKTQLDLSVPKFSLENEYNLISPLKELGLNSLFTSSADLSGIAGQSNLLVSKAIHKAVFNMTEKGAEASSVVGMVGVPHIWIPPVVVRVDRPFLFLIRDNISGLILFLGQVLSL